MQELGTRDELSGLSNLIETFEKVLEWLEKLEIRTDIGRIVAYCHYFNELMDDPKNESVLTIHRANISRELFELVWIYQNFLDYDSEKIIFLSKPKRHRERCKCLLTLRPFLIGNYI